MISALLRIGSSGASGGFVGNGIEVGFSSWMAPLPVLKTYMDYYYPAIAQDRRQSY